jgi:RHS repeat-associated protein
VLTTDNSQSAAIYPAATMETATAATETTYYSNLDKVRNFRPQGFTTLQSNNEKVALLKGADPNKQVGPSITIKVNSGDTISLTAQSFYPEGSESRRNGLSETALGQLMSALIAPTGLNTQGKALATDALKAQAFGSSNSYQNVMGQLPSSDYGKENNRPKAYMVWMLFDKEMKMVKTGRSSGATQIPEGAGQVKSMAENNIVMDQGGFLTAYTVSESPSSVYIDNFQLTQTTGQVMEMNDYYPFGMINNGLSNPGTTSPLNNYKYNGKELQNELSLAWLDYGARFYDPQIGRFHSIDPHSENYFPWTPYNYVGNNPALVVDPDGNDWGVRVEQDKNGNTTYYLTVNAVLYNNSSNSNVDINKLQSAISKQVNEVYNFSGEGFTVKMNFNLRAVTSVNDIKETDNVFQVVDQSIVGKGAYAIGERNGLNVNIGADYVGDITSGKNTRTIPHELGHTAGWDDANLIKNPTSVDPQGGDLKDNLMTQTRAAQRLNNNTPNIGTIARTILPGQLSQLQQNYKSGNINLHSPIYTPQSKYLLPNSCAVSTPITLTKEKALRR